MYCVPVNNSFIAIIKENHGEYFSHIYIFNRNLDLRYEVPIRPIDDITRTCVEFDCGDVMRVHVFDGKKNYTTKINSVRIHYATEQYYDDIIMNAARCLSHKFMFKCDSLIRYSHSDFHRLILILYLRDLVSDAWHVIELYFREIFDIKFICAHDKLFSKYS